MPFNVFNGKSRHSILPIDILTPINFSIKLLFNFDNCAKFFPLMYSVNIDVDDIDIAHPSPVNFISLIILFLITS